MNDPVEKGRAFLPTLLLTGMPLFAMGIVAITPGEGPEKVRYESIAVHFAANPAGQNPDRSQANEITGATGESGSESKEGAKHIYLSEVIRRIESAKRYPMREKKAGIEDRVTVKLKILANGSIQECFLTGNSRYDGFNQEALASIRRAGPFPPFPVEFDETETTLYITLDFRLQ